MHLPTHELTLISTTAIVNMVVLPAVLPEINYNTKPAIVLRDGIRIVSGFRYAIMKSGGIIVVMMSGRRRKGVNKQINIHYSIVSAAGNVLFIVAERFVYPPITLTSSFR